MGVADGNGSGRLDFFFFSKCCLAEGKFADESAVDQWNYVGAI